MQFVFGNLPDGVDTEEFKDFLSQFCTVKKVDFFQKSEIDIHSDYECVADLNISSPLAASYLQKRLNNYCWKGRRIHTHFLLF